MSYPQYGVYLIPPPPLIYAISLAHQVLSAEFGTVTGSRFMAHCTIKGFTKLAPGVSPDDLVPALDNLFARSPAFSTEIEPPWVERDPTGGVSALLWLTKSEAFQKLHEEVWAIVAPYVAADCLFTPREPAGPNFPHHLTLVQSDLPAEPGLLAQGRALVQYIYDNLPAHEFLARDIQLVEFHSDDWAGAWWETLRYRQLKGWSLPGGGSDQT
jgi:2'-5' RNA ligase superfamily protein